MITKKHQIVCLLLSLTMVFVLIAGCTPKASKTGETTPAAPSTEKEEKVSEAPSDPTGRKTKITYWNGFTGPDGVILEELVKEYNETNTANIEVAMEIMPWDSLFQKLSTVLAVNEGPDILAFATERIGTYAKPGALVAIDDIYENKLVDNSVIPESLNENLKFDGKYYGVPMNMATLLLYYNKDMFKDAGLNPEKPPKTWDELEEYALKLTNANGNEQYGFGLATNETIPMWPIMIWGGGGDFIKDGKSVLNSPENVETVKRWSKLIREDKIAPPTMTGGEIDKLFESQKLAMYFCGPWATGGFTNANINFGVAPAPKGSVNDVTLGTGVAMVMTSSSKNKEAVFDFFRHWNTVDTQVKWSLGTGFPLARTDAISDSRLAENAYVVSFSEVAGSANFYLQQLTNFSQIDAQVIIPALESILLTGTDVQATLDEYSAQMDALLAK